MKKTYIIPDTLIVRITGGTILIGASDSEITEDTKNDFDYVKSDRTSSRYNVWDDDWSE